jgi:hypothetical protein
MHFYTGAPVLGISVLFQVHVTVTSPKCDSPSMIYSLMPRCGLFGAWHFTKYVLVLVHGCCMQCTAKVSSGRSRALCCCRVSFLDAAHSHWYRLSIPLAFLLASQSRMWMKLKESVPVHIYQTRNKTWLAAFHPYPHEILFLSLIVPLRIAANK